MTLDTWCGKVSVVAMNSVNTADVLGCLADSEVSDVEPCCDEVLSGD